MKKYSKILPKAQTGIDDWVQRAANANLNFWEMCRLASSADNGKSGFVQQGDAPKQKMYASPYEELADIKGGFFDKDQMKNIKRTLPQGVSIDDWVAFNREAGRMNVKLSNPDYAKYTDSTGMLKPEWQSVATNFDPYYLYYRPAFANKTSITPDDIMKFYQSQPGGISNFKLLVNNGYRMPKRQIGGNINLGPIPYQETYMGRPAPVSSDNTRLAPILVPNIKIPFTDIEKYAARKAKEQPASISSTPARRSNLGQSWVENAYPMTALGYRMKGQPIPANFERGEINPYDQALAAINPFRWAHDFSNTREDLQQGNYTQAAFDVASILPFLSEAKAITPRLRLIGQDVKAAGNYLTTQTPLKNTWRLNPKAYQYNLPQNTMWRGLGNIEGVEDAIESGVFRSKQNVTPQYHNGYPIHKSFDKVYFSPKFNVAASYGDDYIAEVPKYVSRWTNRYKGDNWSQFSNQPISVMDGRILKKDWLRGYKEVPTVHTDIKNLNGKNFSSIIDYKNDISGGNGQFNFGVYPFKRDPRFLLKLDDVNANAMINDQAEILTDLPKIFKNINSNNVARVYRDIDFTGSPLPIQHRKYLDKVASFNVNRPVAGRVMNKLTGEYPRKLSPSVINEIPTQSLQDLIDDAKMLHQNNIDVDYVGDNILYDKNTKKFNFLDLQKSSNNPQSDWIYGKQNGNLNVEKIKEALLAKFRGSISNHLNYYSIDPVKSNFTIQVGNDIFNKLKSVKKLGGQLNNIKPIIDSKGQWAHPGKVTRIPSNQITMQGVPYPVFGVGNNGQTQMMYPEQEYNFDGASYVDEYPMMMKNGGYVVTRSHDRKGKTHKVTGPDGTVKYFGDSKLGQHPNDPERKKAFYARHKKNLENNPYFRAFARKTWEEGGEIMQQGGSKGVLPPTTADSARLYNSQIALNDFYNKEVKAGRLKKSAENFFNPVDLESLKNENLNFYRTQIKNREFFNNSGIFDQLYKKFFNLSPEQIKILELKGLGQSKAGNQYQQYYRDIVTPMQNLVAPFALIDTRIKPQRYIRYDSYQEGYPGGNVEVYDYDPLAIKPYNMRTPQEKVEWEEKYGKKKPIKSIKYKKPQFLQQDFYDIEPNLKYKGLPQQIDLTGTPMINAGVPIGKTLDQYPTNYSVTFRDENSPSHQRTQYFPDLQSWRNFTDNAGYMSREQTADGKFAQALGYNQYKSGGEMIRRADGSYSRRGLWDNIRENKGSGKKPTKEMLEQEHKIKRSMQVGGSMQTRPTFEQWYNTVPINKNDTSTYNLRRAYELAPQSQLNAFVANPDAHLFSAYENPKTGIWEFMKSSKHPTIQYELDWFNSNDPEAIKFRKKYNLDKSGDYYKYVPKKQVGGGLWNTNRTQWVDSVNNANMDKNFIQRYYLKNGPSIQIPGERGRSTHFMESSDNMVYPTVVQMPNGKLQYLNQNDKDGAYKYAMKTGQFIKFPNEEQALWYGGNGYKTGTGVMIGKKQTGGSIPKYQSRGEVVLPNTLLKKKIVGSYITLLKDLNLQEIKNKSTDGWVYKPNCPNGVGCAEQAVDFASQKLGLPRIAFIPGDAAYRTAQMRNEGMIPIWDPYNGKSVDKNYIPFPSEKYKDLKIGDQVGLTTGGTDWIPYNPPSYLTKNDNNHVEHWGTVSGFTPDGVPYIHHGYGNNDNPNRGRYFDEPISEKGTVRSLGHGKYRIGVVYRTPLVTDDGVQSIDKIVQSADELAQSKANTTGNAKFYLKTTPEDDLLNSGYPVAAQFANAKTRLQTKKDLVGLFQDKELDYELKYKLGLSQQEIDRMKPVIYGMAGQETNFDDPNFYRGLKETVAQLKRNPSLGMFQIKMNSLTDDEKRLLNINKKSDLKDTRKAYMAAMAIIKNSKKVMDRKVEKGVHPDLENSNIDPYFRALYYYNTPMRAINSAAEMGRKESKTTLNPVTWFNWLPGKQITNNDLFYDKDKNELRMDPGSYPYKVLQKAKKDLGLEYDNSGFETAPELEKVVVYGAKNPKTKVLLNEKKVGGQYSFKYNRYKK